MWLYSIQSEVFSLNNMLCAWTLFLAVKCVSSSGAAPLRLGALFVGLCSCNQHTSILLFTPAVVWIYVNRSKDVHANILSLIACGLVGLLPYLFIPYQVHPDACSTPCAPSHTRSHCRAGIWPSWTTGANTAQSRAFSITFCARYRIRQAFVMFWSAF